MKIFGQFVRTAINVVTLPVNVAADAIAAPFETKRAYPLTVSKS